MTRMPQELPVHHLSVKVVPVHDEQQGQRRHQRQLQVHVPHHLPQHHHQHHRRVEGRHYRGAQQHLHRAHVIGEVGHQIPGLVLVEVAHGQLLQVGEQILLQVPSDRQPRAEDEKPPAEPAHGHPQAHQQDEPHQAPHPVHGHGPRPEAVGDLAGELGDVDVHQVHPRQGGDPQQVPEPVGPDVSANQFQFFHVLPL